MFLFSEEMFTVKSTHAKQQIDYGLRNGYDTLILAISKEIIVVLLYLADHLVVALGTGALLGEDFEKLKQGNCLHQGLHFEGKDPGAHPKW